MNQRPSAAGELKSSPLPRGGEQQPIEWPMMGRAKIFSLSPPCAVFAAAEREASQPAEHRRACSRSVRDINWPLSGARARARDAASVSGRLAALGRHQRFRRASRVRMPAPAFAGARKINGQVNLSSSSFLSKLPATLFQCASGASAAPAANQFVMRGAARPSSEGAPSESRVQTIGPTDRPTGLDGKVGVAAPAFPSRHRVCSKQLEEAAKALALEPGKRQNTRPVLRAHHSSSQQDARGGAEFRQSQEG